MSRLSATVPPVIPAGTNVANLPFNENNRGSIAALNTPGFTYCQVMFGNSIRVFPGRWKIKVKMTQATSAGIVEMCLIRTLRGSLNVIDVTPIKFGGFSQPILALGENVSDLVNLLIDADHDYYFCFSGNAFGGTGAVMANNGSTSVPTFDSFAGNVNNGGNPLSVAWAATIGAGGGWAGAFPLGSGAYFLSGWQAA